MEKKINRLIKSKFIRNVVIMATGTAGAQIITMILSPIITRLYGPEAFGIMGTFNAMVNLIVPIAALTYPVAIVLPKDNQEAKGLIKLSIVIAGVISVLSFFIIALFEKQLVKVFNLEEIAIYLYLIPLVVIFSGFMQVAGQWLIRTKQFSINARVTFLESLITNGSKVAVGFFYPISSVLVIFSAMSDGLKAFLMFLFADKPKYKEKNQINDENSLKVLAKKYYDFPLYRAPESFISSISDGLPVLMLTTFFGSATVGFYTIGRTVLSIPSQFIGKAVGDVFYPRITEAANNNENVTKIIKKATFALSVVGIIPFGLVTLFGPFLFSLVFGNDWVIAGEYARWISLWAYTSFINRPCVRSLAVLNAQRFHLIYTVFMMVTRLILLSVGFYIFSNDIVAIALFGISGAILNIGLIVITLKISRRKLVVR